MGHKVNPISFRLPVKKNWQSKWFAKKNFQKNLLSDIEIRRALEKRFGKISGVSQVNIIRSADGIKIVIFTSKPGILIGRSGQGINEIKLYLVKNCSLLRNAKTGAPETKIEIEIMEVKNLYLSAELVAQTVAYQIERRIAYKKAIRQAIDKVMSAKAKGIKITVSGRLSGAEIARTEKYGSGSVPLGRLRAEIDFAKVDALTTYGVVGVKVWIYKNEQTNDEEV